MARNEQVTVPASTWTRLTNADITAGDKVTFMVIGDYAYIAGTTSAAAPADTSTSILFQTGDGFRNVALTELFNGISVNNLYAYAPQGTTIFVSHA